MLKALFLVHFSSRGKALLTLFSSFTYIQVWEEGGKRREGRYWTPLKMISNVPFLGIFLTCSKMFKQEVATQMVSCPQV